MQSTGSSGTAPFDSFVPPSDYRFEPELQGTPPRHVPEEFRQAPCFLRQRNTCTSLLLAGGLCAGLGQLSFIHEIGLYLLLFAYLSWIGLGLLVLGAAGWISSKIRRGPLKYVGHGIPLVSRIRELVLRPTVSVHGQPSTYAFTAAVEYIHPETGARVTKRFDSRSFSASAKGNYRSSYRVGDLATLVYLKSKPDKTLRLYGFLELRPDLGLVAAKTAQPETSLKTALKVSLLFAFFGLLIWNVYAISKYMPLELSFSRVAAPIGIGGVIFGGGLIGFLWSHRAQSHRELAARNQRALVEGEAVELETVKRGLFGSRGLLKTVLAGSGAIFLGGGTFFCLCLTANALLDNSKPKLRPVEIVQFWSTTHDFLFREYEIEYRFPGEEKSRRLLSTPAQMRQFQFKAGIAEVHVGRFGWSWVKNVAPLPLPEMKPES